MRDHLEPESFDDTFEETRPALGDEAKKALAQADARRRALAPLVDKDAETVGMPQDDYQKALQRLQQARVGGGSVPPPPPAKNDDPMLALQQLSRQRDNGAPAPAPPPPGSRPSAIPPSSQGAAGANGTGPNRAFKALNEDVPNLKDLAAGIGRRSMASVPPPPSGSAPPPPPGTEDVIANLLGNSGSPPSNTNASGNTAQLNVQALGLKPSTTPMPLPAQRTPLPIAVVGGGGLRVNGDRGSMPPSGFGVPVKTQPSAQAPSRPPGATTPSRMPGRPASAPGTPPKQYDFKRWSSPDISEMPNDGQPVTFQVYTAQDVAAGRAPMRSMAMIDQKPKSTSIALKVGLAVLGVVIVLITAAAVIMVSTDDPKRPNAPPMPSAEPALSSMVDPTPSTPVIVIGDSPTAPAEDPTPPPASAPATRPARPHPVAAPPPAPVEHPAAAPVPKNVTPPPNPYGKP